MSSRIATTDLRVESNMVMARVLLVKTGVLTATSLLELKGMSMKDLRAKAFETGLTESDLDDALDEATVSLTLPCRVSACAGSAAGSIGAAA